MSCLACGQVTCCCPPPITVAPPPVPSLPGVACPTTPVVTTDLSIATQLEPITCFNVPIVGGSISVSVLCIADWAGMLGCCVIVKDATLVAIYRIDLIDATAGTITLSNQDYTGNPPPGTPFAGPCFIWPIGLCPSTGQAAECAALRVLTFEAFNIAAVGADQNVKFSGCLDVEVGQKLFIEALGTVLVKSIVTATAPTELELTTCCLTGGAIAGAVIGVGSYMVTSEICVVTDATLSGSGVTGDPLHVETGFEPFNTASLPRLDITPRIRDVPPDNPNPSPAWDILPVWNGNAYDGNAATFTEFLHTDPKPHGWIMWDLGAQMTGWFYIDFELNAAGGAGVATYQLRFNDVETAINFTPAAGSARSDDSFTAVADIGESNRHQRLQPFAARFIGVEIQAGGGTTARFRIHEMRIFAKAFSI